MIVVGVVVVGVVAVGVAVVAVDVVAAGAVAGMRTVGAARWATRSSRPTDPSRCSPRDPVGSCFDLALVERKQRLEVWVRRCRRGVAGMPRSCRTAGGSRSRTPSGPDLVPVLEHLDREAQEQARIHCRSA